jgi:hypothetical protein
MAGRRQFAEKLRMQLIHQRTLLRMCAVSQLVEERKQQASATDRMPTATGRVKR